MCDCTECMAAVFFSVAAAVSVALKVQVACVRQLLPRPTSHMVSACLLVGP